MLSSSLIFSLLTVSFAPRHDDYATMVLFLLRAKTDFLHEQIIPKIPAIINQSHIGDDVTFDLKKSLIGTNYGYSGKLKEIHNVNSMEFEFTDVVLDTTNSSARLVVDIGLRFKKDPKLVIDANANVGRLSVGGENEITVSDMDFTFRVGIDAYVSEFKALRLRAEMIEIELDEFKISEIDPKWNFSGLDYPSWLNDLTGWLVEHLADLVFTLKSDLEPALLELIPVDGKKGINDELCKIEPDIFRLGIGALHGFLQDRLLRKLLM